VSGYGFRKRAKAGKPISAFLLYLESDILTREPTAGLTHTVSGLPSWLAFDSGSYTFTGIVPENYEEEINITVEGSNDNGTFIKETFLMRLIEPDSVPVVLLLLVHLEKWVSETNLKMLKIFSRNFNKNNNLVR
jgi:hypothetical protein